MRVVSRLCALRGGVWMTFSDLQLLVPMGGGDSNSINTGVSNGTAELELLFPCDRWAPLPKTPKQSPPVHCPVYHPGQDGAGLLLLWSPSKFPPSPPIFFKNLINS